MWGGDCKVKIIYIVKYHIQRLSELYSRRAAVPILAQNCSQNTVCSCKPRIIPKKSFICTHLFEDCKLRLH